MKEITDGIKKRRSIRKFKDKDIADSLIKEVLYAASIAPSAHNKQPWEFIVIKSKSLKNQIADFLLAHDMEQGKITSSSQTAMIIKEAPVLILVLNRFEEHPLFCHLSLGAAIENMLLEATHLDLGSLWIGNIVKVEDKVGTLLGRNIHLVSAVALGYTDEIPAMPERNLIDAITDWRE